MTSNATYSRTITVDLPDFASKAVSFSLVTSVAIDAANNEVFPRKEYSLTLDGSGTGSIALPCPDNTGDAAWAWRVSLPDGRDVTTTMAYAGTSLDLSDWLTAATTSETADAITALIESKADKVSGATADNLAGLDANGNLQDSGYGVIDEDSMATDSATDVPTQQSVKAYVDAQIGTVDDVTELTTTTGASTNMLRVAAAGGLEYRTTAQVLSDIGAEASGAAATVQGNLDSHTGNTSNPHSVTAAQVGAYTSGETDTAIDTDIGTHAALTSSVHGISVFGATLVDDADAATARGTLGLGSAAVEDASAFDAAGSAAAAQAASQPLDADLTAIAGLSSADSNFIVGSATGWVAESGATVRTSLGLGSAAVEDASAFDAAGSAAAAQAASQPLDSDLTAIAGLSSADSNFIVGSATGWVAESGATVRASLGLGSAAVEDTSAFDAAGSAAAAQAASQPVDADLTAIAGLSSADGNFIVGSATGWVAESGATALASIGAAAASHTHAASDVTSGTLVHERGGLEADVSAYSGLVKITGGVTSAVTVTTFGESLIDDADAATARTTLGLGTMATEATTSYLAATGATTGATSQAQAFTSGVTTGANGLDVNPGSDIDADLITVGVTGTPAMSWDESEDKFSLNKPFTVLTQSGGATLFLRAVQAAQYSGFNIYDNVNTLAVSFQYGNTSAAVFGDTAFLASRKSTTPLAFYQGGASSGNKRIVLNTSGYTEVHQPGATAAVPVLLLNQADDSEDMIEFTGTVGTGNAIEAVGAKTLTTTHFIKCTITGVGAVYIPVGTIA